MNYSDGISRLGFPPDFKFGIELEAYNVDTYGKNGLYVGESAEFIKNRNWHMASAKEESLVSHGGAELVSPVLDDSENSWKNLSDICSHMQEYPGSHGDKVVADNKCGLHIHFDATCLANHPDRMKNFMRLYAESEELLFKMCNDKNDPIRPSAINKDRKGLTHLVSSFWRNGMAAPIGKRVLKQIENNTLKVSYKKFNALQVIAGKFKLDERRYAGLNLTNIGNPHKNTIEFRMANGTLDPNIIRQNAFLYASLINTSIKMTENPELYADKLNTFYKTDVDEKTKAGNFLNLIMDNDSTKQIYMDRWESVKDAPVFANNSRKSFAQNRFNRDNYKSLAFSLPNRAIQNALNFVASTIHRQPAIQYANLQVQKSENSFEREDRENR